MAIAETDFAIAPGYSWRRWGMAAEPLPVASWQPLAPAPGPWVATGGAGLGGGRAGAGGGVGLGAVSAVGAGVVVAGVGGGSAVSQGVAAEGNGCSAGATGMEEMNDRSESLTVGAARTVSGPVGNLLTTVISMAPRRR